MSDAVSFNRSLPRLILCLVVIFTLILSAVTWHNPPALYPDPSWGFQVLRSMEQGGGFNELLTPCHNDIRQNCRIFLTWWSPGQYLFPYFFKSLFHLNYGQAATATSLFAGLLGLTGFYLFFRKAGFSRMVAAISIAVIATQAFYFIPYIFYNGGEVLVFAFAGWFFYGCLSFKKPGWQLVLFILLAGWIGFLCKSAFIWIYAAGLLGLWITFNRLQNKISYWLKIGLWIGLPAVISMGSIYLLFLSKGHNPAATHKNIRVIWESILFPLAAPLLSGFSVDDLTGGLIYTTEEPLLSYSGSLLIILIFAVITLWVLRLMYHNSHITPAYKTMLSATFGVAVLFFGFAYLIQSAISFEARHFRVAGILFIPVIVQLIINVKRRIHQIAAGLLWLVMSAFSLIFLIKGKANNRNESAHGPAGVSQQFTDNYSLGELLKLDQPNHNAIFVFTNPDLALEITHNRVITLLPVGPDINISYQDFIFKGHTGPLYIFLPTNYSPVGKRAILKQCFPGYSHFEHRLLSEDYELYRAE